MKKITIVFALLAMQLSFGQITWKKAFGGSGYEDGTTMIKTPDGGYIIVGTSDSQDGDMTDVNFTNTANYSFDISLIKMDANGVLQWQKFYGSSYNLDGNPTLINTSDGGYLLSFDSEGTDGDITGNYGSSDVIVLKLNGTGDVVWSNHYGGSNRDVSPHVIENNNGTYSLFCITNSTDHDVLTSSTNLNDSMLYLHLNNSGLVLDSKTFGTHQYSDFYTQPAAIGNFIYFTNDESQYDIDYNLINWELHFYKIDLSGNIQVQSTTNLLAFPIQAHRCKLVFSPSGQIQIFGVNAIDNSIGRVDFNVNLQPINFTIYVSNTDQKYLASSFYNTAGELFLGISDKNNSLGYGAYDYLLNKYDTSGTLVSSKNFGGSEDDNLSGAILDGNNVVLFGYTYSSNYDVVGFHPGVDTFGNPNPDVFIVKYNTDGLLSNSNFKPVDITFSPNPVKDVLSIQGLDTEKINSIHIYDLLGKETFLKIENTNNQIDMSVLSNGVYVVKITTESNQVKAFKVIKE